MSRRFEDVTQDFAARIKVFEQDFPKPTKSYIAYNGGKVLETDNYTAAKAFSPKGLIEVIEPDPAALAAWRREKYALENEIIAQWKKELYADIGLPDKVSDRVFEFVQNETSEREEQAQLFYDAALMVESCLRLVEND